MRRLIWNRLIVALLLNLAYLLETSWPILGRTQRHTLLPTNTAIHVRLTHQLDTISTQAEEIFFGTLSKSVVIDDRLVFACGTKVIGRVREVASSGHLQRLSSITLELTDLSGMSIRTKSLRIDGRAHLLRDVRLIGIDARAGAPLGGVAWVGSGAGSGFGIGADSRTPAYRLTDDNEIVLPAETVLVFYSLEIKSIRKR